MIHYLWFSDKVPPSDATDFFNFAQRMANRRTVGNLRYGQDGKRIPFLWRLRRCLKEYRLDGNGEHLIDAAVYAYREFINPNHPKFHFNPYAESVTRGCVRRRVDRDLGSGGNQ